MSLPLQKITEPKTIEFVPFGAADKIKLSVEIVKNIIAVPTKSGKTCPDKDAMKFIMLCSAQRLNPFAGDAFLTGYEKKDGTVQFSLITAHIAFLKRAETCADYEGMESGIILMDAESKAITEREGDFKLKEEICVGGWARVYRKNRKPTYRRLSVSAMIPNYDTPFWSEDKTPGQIVKCAEADALRSTFPTLLGGLYSEGEIIDIPSRGAQTIETSIDMPPGRKEITPGSESKVARTAQEDLEALTIEAGFTFTETQKWGMETGNIAGADSIASFAEIPKADAQRILRSQTGYLDGLKRIKELA